MIVTGHSENLIDILNKWYYASNEAPGKLFVSLFSSHWTNAETIADVQSQPVQLFRISFSEESSGFLSTRQDMSRMKFSNADRSGLLGSFIALTFTHVAHSTTEL